MANLLMLTGLASASKCHPVHGVKQNATPAPPIIEQRNSINIDRRTGKLQEYVTGNDMVKGPCFIYNPLNFKHKALSFTLKAYPAAQADTRLHVTHLNRRYIEPAELIPFSLPLSISILYIFIFICASVQTLYQQGFKLHNCSGYTLCRSVQACNHLITNHF